MWISQEQASKIRQLVQHRLGEMSEVWLFGSRVDDAKRGGYIDLYVETTQACDLSTKLSLVSEIQRSIGLRKIDLLVKTNTTPERPIYCLPLGELKPPASAGSF